MTLIVKGSVSSSAIDYVTITQTVDHTGRTEIDEMYDSLLTHEDLKPVKWGGYIGYQDGEGRYGRRTREGKVDKILLVPGSSASEFSEFDKADLDQLNLTRLDLQVTVMMPYREVDLARRYFDLMKGDAGYKSSMVGRRKINLIDGTDGQTLYIGSRNSRSFLFRMYDKSKSYNSDTGWYWRFEFEFKRDLAKSVAEEVLLSDNPEAKIAEIVGYKCYTDCGIALPIGVHTRNFEFKLENEARKSTMEWLERCVKPVVSRETIAGNCDDVIRALGMEWLIEVKLNSKT